MITPDINQEFSAERVYWTSMWSYQTHSLKYTDVKPTLSWRHRTGNHRGIQVAFKVPELDDITLGEKRRGPRTELAFLFFTDNIKMSASVQFPIYTAFHT